MTGFNIMLLLLQLLLLSTSLEWVKWWTFTHSSTNHGLPSFCFLYFIFFPSFTTLDSLTFPLNLLHLQLLIQWMAPSFLQLVLLLLLLLRSGRPGRIAHQPLLHSSWHGRLSRRHCLNCSIIAYRERETMILAPDAALTKLCTPYTTFTFIQSLHLERSEWVWLWKHNWFVGYCQSSPLAPAPKLVAIDSPKWIMNTTLLDGLVCLDSLLQTTTHH